MPFEDIVPTRSSQRGKLASDVVSVGLYSNGELQIVIPDEIMKKLGWPYDCRILFQEGSVSDAGHFALTQSAAGFKPLQRSQKLNTGGVVVRVPTRLLGHHIASFSLGSRVDSVAVTTQAFGGRIIAMFPTWIVEK